MLNLLTPSAPLFHRRVWPYAFVLIIGTLLAPGKRTVIAALRIMRLEHARRLERYHRVVNRARWSSFAVSRVLLSLLVTACRSDRAAAPRHRRDPRTPPREAHRRQEQPPGSRALQPWALRHGERATLRLPHALGIHPL